MWGSVSADSRAASPSVVWSVGTDQRTHTGHHTMVLDRCALLEQLGELKLIDVTDRIRVATETRYEELIKR